MSPKLAHKFYDKFVRNENFNIQTAHDISFHSEVVHIPVVKEFNTPEFHKFFLIKFSEKYDGLIGLDLLIQLKAKVKLNAKMIITLKAKIPMIYKSEELTELKNDLLQNNYIVVIPA